MRHLITTIPQAGGGTRELYAATASAARSARRAIADDPTMIDAIRPSEIVDITPDGRRERVR